MTIERLLEVVPPPAEPFEAYSGPWEPIEAEFGVVLPQDYKEFVRLYGSGYFMEILGVHVPRSHNANVRFEWQVHMVRWMFKDDDEISHLLWPARGGLLPFGGTDFGDELFWLTRGPPEEWPIVVWGRGMQRLEMFECDLTDFLAGLATGEILPEDFPEGILGCDKLFQPSSALEPPPHAA